MPIAETPTILIVNDNEHYVTSITRVLRSDPYRILSASCGAAALDLLCVEAVDVMVIDETLPDMSGTDLAMDVLLQFPTVVSIRLSGQASQGTVIQALNHGETYRFLIKPNSVTELGSHIRQALRYKKMLDSCPQVLPIFRRQSQIIATQEHRHDGIIQSAGEHTHVIERRIDPQSDDDLAELLEVAIAHGYSMSEMTCER
jgi:DNA-binding NtrC family response regulator